MSSSLEEVQDLELQVRNLYDTGKRELALKKLREHEEVKHARELLRATMPEWNNRPAGAVRNRQDLNKEYKGVRGKVRKILDWATAKTMGAQRFFDWLDHEKANFKGAWVKLFVDNANKAYDIKLRYKFNRIGAFEETLQSLGLTPAMITAERNVDVPHTGSVNWTVDELMSIYAGMKNERSRIAILFGNFAAAESKEQAEEWAAKCIEALTDNEKKLADFIISEYEQNRERINDALIDVYNKGMEYEENYTPMRRLEYTSSNRSMVNPDAAENLFSSQSGSGMAGVQKGFSISRVKFGEKRQSPIDLGLTNIWHSQVEAQEHMAAFAGLVKKLRSVLLGRDENSGTTIRQMVKATRGQPAWDMIRRYFNILAADDIQNSYDTLEDVSQFMAKNMSIAYLCGNLGTMLKQTSSFFRAFPHAGAKNMLNSIGQFLQNPKQFLETCYNLDPQLRNRRGDPFIRALQNSTNSLYQNILKWGMAPIGFTDRVTSAIVFKSVYDANIKQGLSENDAIREAQRVVLLTQPAYNIKDKPLIWQQSGWARLAMMFTSDMAQTFGISLYDLTQALRNGEIHKGLATLTGLTLAAMTIRLLSSGFPDDPDDPEEWAKWIAGAFTSQFINSIPLIGKELITLWDAKNGYFNNNSAFVAPVAKLFKCVKGFSDSKKDWLEDGAIPIIEGMSLLAPFPATAMRRLYYLLKHSGQGEVSKALQTLLGQRTQDKNLRKSIYSR